MKVHQEEAPLKKQRTTPAETVTAAENRTATVVPQPSVLGVFGQQNPAEIITVPPQPSALGVFGQQNRQVVTPKLAVPDFTKRFGFLK